MTKLDELCLNSIRFLAIDATEKAGSGHPGAPMGTAGLAYVLWTKHMRHNPADPRWPNRDRFILSAGHASMLLYAMLYLTGYDLSLDDIREFRQLGSKTPGHPEYRHTPGVEMTTGPLGQGFTAGVGMAIAERYLAEYFNRPDFDIIDYRIYALCSDGDLMEGVSHEAASLAGHLGLDKLIYIYDDNRVSIEGGTELAFSEDVTRRFESYGWYVQEIDGNDLRAVDEALHNAKAQRGRPSLIRAHTHIGYGSPHKQGTASAHGEPLGPEEAEATKKNLGWPTEPDFYVPEEALTHMREAVHRGRDLQLEWEEDFSRYRQVYPDLAEQLAGDGLPPGWEESLPTLSDGMSTREASGRVLNAVAPALPFLVGGSADLAPSTKTYLKGFEDFSRSGTGRNLRFGVREHAMGACLNGMALTPPLIPYGGTFLIFSDYMRPSIRLAAMMGLRVIYVFTHDSIFLGEDGPTHQPVEQIASLRAIPNLTVIRPADASETPCAWRAALERTDGPTALILSRQNLPALDRSLFPSPEMLERGAYVLWQAREGEPDILLLATGSEVHIILEAARVLGEEGINVRVVNMPSWELFDSQPVEYRESVIPPAVTRRLAVEAASPLGWERYAGSDGGILGMSRFGASGKYADLAEYFGFTAKNVASRARAMVRKDENSNRRGPRGI